MDKKLGKEPAFSCCNENSYLQEGMSKRFYAACAAMQGLCSAELQDITINKAGERVSKVVELAYKYADELLSKENM